MRATEMAYGTGRLRCGFGRRATGRAPILALLGVVAGGLLGARPVRAVMVTLPSAGDSWIDEGAQNTNKGTDGHMHVLSTVSKLRRGVIQFDLSSIPACASVTSATLRMTIENAGNASRTYGAHRVTASWTEGGVTWLRRNSTTLWTSAGGDFVAAPTDSVPTGTTKNVFLEWNVTPDVAAYVSGAAGNFGWLVKDEAENVGKIEFLLRNREDGDGPTPELVVTYTLTDTPACDDGSGCTTDTCDFAGCHYTPVADGTECNDGDGCTQIDTCQGGTCTGGTPVACPAPDQCHDAGTCDPATGLCSNPSMPDGVGCDDGDLCTQSDTCQGGTCTGANPVGCTAPDQCHDAGTCDPATGACSNPAKADGAGCNDGDLCTQSDTCQGGTCTGANPVACPAPDQCHDAGTCDPATGVCSNPAKADGAACDDGDACTQTDTCQAGTCVGGNALPNGTPCDDGNTCTQNDACQGGTCVGGSVLPDGAPCDDGNVCTRTDTCQAGACVGGSPAPDGTTCDDGNTCTQTDTCQAGACVGGSPAPDGTTCDDGDTCTQTDTCQAGACVGSSPLPDGTACDDGETCTGGDQCLSGRCTGTPVSNGTTCDDGQDCTANDQCVAGRCIGSVAPDGTSCDDGDACTATDVCTTGSCHGMAIPDGGGCDDGDGCTQTDTCQGGTCTGDPVVCTAQDQCHDAGTCDPATGLCSNPSLPDDTGCDDGDACTQTDTCQGGTCTAGNSVTCTAQDQCHDAGTCDPATGACSNPVKADGAGCNDGDLCTQSDTCQGGTCTGANPVGCTAPDQCHDAGTCDPATGACSNPAKADGAGCNDGDACSQTDTCQGGTCTGGNPVACPAPDQCHTAGTCDPATGACSNPAKADGAGCDDGDACTQSDTCQGGTCTAVNPVVCTAQDQCHDAGVCDPLSATCSNPVTPDGTPCNDGDANTLGDACNAGVCTGTPSGIDNFLCYRARTTTGTPPFSPIDQVSLVDHFNSMSVTVRRPLRVCAAADVGAGTFNPAALFESYRIRRLAGPYVRERGLQMTNLLGTFVVDAVKPNRLLMPTVEGTPTTGADAAPSADHYGCYEARLSRGQKFPKGLQLTVGAQFTPQPKIFRVRKPKGLCAPVGVDGRAMNPDDPFLLCFRVKGVRGQPKPRRVVGLAVHNEFGGESLTSRRERELCLPTLLMGAELGPASVADAQDD